MQHTLTGTFRCHKLFSSRPAEGSHELIVYLPPGYNETPTARYPVLYMHDGQNLFDAATAFLNQEWGLDELAESLMQEGSIEPLIIVGIHNAGEKRIDEYTPVRDRKGQGGRARLHARFVVQELKPFIDAEYRTLPDPANTGLGGSSLGGLATLYLGLRYPEVFGKLIVMSPSIWWAHRAIFREVRQFKGRLHPKIWLDTGTCEGEAPETCIRNVRDLRDALIERGWKLGRDLRHVEDEGAGHNEKAWGFRMKDALAFLFSPPSVERSVEFDAEMELHA